MVMLEMEIFFFLLMDKLNHIESRLYYTSQGVCAYVCTIHFERFFHRIF